MLIVHHLGISQSERIVWLCEELGLEYQLVLHTRNPKTNLSPDSLKSVPGNVFGNAPFIQDDGVTVSESGAIVEYIINKHGNGRFAVPSSQPNYADYLYWFHFANGSLQPHILQAFYLSRVQSDNPIKAGIDRRLSEMFTHINNRLGKVEFLAGNDLTAADIMTVFCLSTMRYWMPISLEEYPNIVKYLARIGQRDAYRRAMQKGDEGFKPVLDAKAPERNSM